MIDTLQRERLRQREFEMMDRQLRKAEASISFAAFLDEIGDRRALRAMERRIAEDDADSWWRDCHEAGHATVALALGIAIDYARRIHDAARGWFGHVQVAESVDPARGLILAAGGMAAEDVLADRPATVFGDLSLGDLNFARRALAALGDPANDPLQSARFSAAVESATQLIRRHRTAAVLIALALNRFKCLNGQRCRKAFEHAANLGRTST